MKSTKTHSTDLEGIHYLITSVLYDFSNLYFENNTHSNNNSHAFDTENLKNTASVKKFYNGM